MIRLEVVNNQLKSINDIESSKLLRLNLSFNKINKLCVKPNLQTLISLNLKGNKLTCLKHL